MIELKSYNFYKSAEELVEVYEQLPLLGCPHCHSIGNLRRHDFIYKQIEFSRPPVSVGKRLWCSKDAGGCGRTIRLQWGLCLYRLWHVSIVIWIFFSLHYIYKRSIRASYAAATNTQNPRNAFRWLNRLFRNIPRLKNTIPPPSKPSSDGNSIELFLNHLNNQFFTANPLLFFQFAHQTHALK